MSTTIETNAILLLGLAAVFLDPLFFYIPVVKNDSTCLGLDNNLRIIVVVFRSFVDVLHTILWWHHILPLVEGRYRLILSRTVAILAILPLPQVVIFAVSGQLLTVLEFIVLIQFIIRLYRVIRAYKDATKSSDMGPIHSLFAAAFNLVMYILASNVLGAFWYLTAVERNMDCWRGACHKNPTLCDGSSICCDNSSSYKTYLHKHCSTKSFDYGIYDEALQTNIIETGVPFLDKFFQCLWWGLRNLSTLGQNLKTSNNYMWDSFFATFIAIIGLVLFALFIGNMEAYLKTIWSKQTFEEQDPAKVEKMKQRTRSLDGWTPFYLLPPNLRKEVLRCNDPRWQGTTEVNLESLLNNIEPTLGRKLMPHLCKGIFSKIPEFRYLSHRQGELCALAKPVVFPERSYIFREGEPILEVFFIVDGSLWSYNRHSTQTGIRAKQLSAGCFCGEELLQQLKFVAQQQQTPKESSLDLPIASKTIKAATKVEAFALPAKDLIKAFGGHNKWAAAIGNAWRKFVKAKREGRAQEG